MGRHGTPDSEVHSPVANGSGIWDTASWEAAIAPSAEDSLYAASDAYQPVNDWSGVYQVPPQADPAYGASGYYDYESYQAAQTPAQSAAYDQSYYESVYASYPDPAQQPVQDPYQDSSAAWDGPAWQDPYAAGDFHAGTYGAAYGEPQFDQYGQYVQQPQQAAYQAPAPQPYQEMNFHHPDFDTGEFERVYAEPGSTEAQYDLLPEEQGYAPRYSDQGYAQQGYADQAYTEQHGAEQYAPGYPPEQYGEQAYAENGYVDGEYDLDYEDGVEYAAEGFEDDYDDDNAYAASYSGNAEPGYDDDYDEDEAPLRSRSRSGAPAPSTRPARPAGTRLPKAAAAIGGRRTLHAITSTPAAVVGVAAVAVAAVGGLRLPGTTDTTTTDAAATPTSGLEQNLLQMRAASANLADRATRSEQRTELAMQQALEKQHLSEMAQKYFLPVQDYILTAGFGDAGAHWANLHTGQDFAVPSGTRVVAVTDGTVVEAGWAGAFGYRIVIQHPDGSQTWYCHLSVMKVERPGQGRTADRAERGHRELDRASPALRVPPAGARGSFERGAGG